MSHDCLHSQKNDELLELHLVSEGEIPMIELIGELDLSTAPKLEGMVSGQLSACPSSSLVMDLSRLTFIDSSGIAVLIRAFQATNGRGAMSIVIAPGTQVARVFRIAGIDSSLPVFVKREEAVDAVVAEAAEGA